MSSRRLKILVFEPELDGHHSRYVAAILKESMDRGHQPVLVTTATALNHPAYDALKTSFGTQCFDVIKMPSPIIKALPRFSRWQLLHRQWLTWLIFYRVFRRFTLYSSYDCVFIPYLNDLDLMISFIGSPFGSLPWGGILMRDRFHHHIVNPNTPPIPNAGVWQWMFERLARRSYLKALFTVDETLVEYYRSRTKIQPPVKYLVGEPIEVPSLIPSCEARRALNVPLSGKYILIYGNVDRRKGIKELLTAFNLCRLREDIKLLIVGDQGVMRQYVREAGHDARLKGQLHEIDRFASSREESLAFSVADLVWVGYSTHHGPSGVLGKAAAAGVPVIACNVGNIGWVTDKHRLGPTVDVSDVHAVVAAISSVLFDSDARNVYEEGCREYAREKTGKRFGVEIVDSLEDACLK